MGAITTGFRLGGLEEAVEAFQDTVGDLAFESAEHASPMVHEVIDDLDQGR